MHFLACVHSETQKSAAMYVLNLRDRVKKLKLNPLAH